MSMTVENNSVELRFIDYSLENYRNVSKELIEKGKKNFLIRGINTESIEFIKKLKNII